MAWMFVCFSSNLWRQLFILFLQFQDLQSSAGQAGEDLHITKTEISDLNRMINRIQCEIEAIKGQVSY